MGSSAEGWGDASKQNSLCPQKKIIVQRRKQTKTHRNKMKALQVGLALQVWQQSAVLEERMETCKLAGGRQRTSRCPRGQRLFSQVT